jgi:hypothetical protein
MRNRSSYGPWLVLNIKKMDHKSCGSAAMNRVALMNWQVFNKLRYNKTVIAIISDAHQAVTSREVAFPRVDNFRCSPHMKAIIAYWPYKLNDWLNYNVLNLNHWFLLIMHIIDAFFSLDTKIKYSSHFEKKPT